MVAITTADDCNKAAVQLGLENDEARTTESSNRPEGFCEVQSSSSLWFSSSNDKIGDGASNSRYQLCVRKPAVATTVEAATPTTEKPTCTPAWHKAAS